MKDTAPSTRLPKDLVGDRMSSTPIVPDPLACLGPALSPLAWRELAVAIGSQTVSVAKERVRTMLTTIAQITGNRVVTMSTRETRAVLKALEFADRHAFPGPGCNERLDREAHDALRKFARRASGSPR